MTDIFSDIILLLLLLGIKKKKAAKVRAIKKLSTGAQIWVKNSCVHQSQEKDCVGHSAPDVPRLQILLLQEYCSTECGMLRSKWLNRFCCVLQGEINQQPGWHIPGALVLSDLAEQKHENGGLPGNKHNCVFAWKPPWRFMAKAYHY